MIINYKIYTPNEYAVKMVDLALERYFKNFGKNKESLENIRVIDLSCGSGNLLLVMLERLLEISKKYYSETVYKKEWLTGVDIDQKALELLKKRAKALFFRYGISDEIILESRDSLEIETQNKYNIVLGNPPYMGEKNHKEIFQKIKQSEFGKKYYRPKMDYFYFFINKGIEILEEKGILVYLTTNYWFKADSGDFLRSHLKEKGDFFKIENYSKSLFKNAIGQHNVIFGWEKYKKNISIDIIEENEVYRISQDELYTEDEKIVLIPETIKIKIEKIKKNSNKRLGNLININQGIVSGADKIYVSKDRRKEIEGYYRPFYKSKDIGMYSVSKKNPFWILYLDHKQKPTNILLEYLNEFKEILEKRREVKKGQINWWELQWSRDEELFLKPKIIVRQRYKINMFAYTDIPFYGSADIYYLTSKSEEINLYYILGFLNSQIFGLWYRYMGKKKGKNLEFYSTPLKETPIYYPKNIEEIKYIEDLVKKQIKSFDESIQKEIELFFKRKYEI